MTLSRPGTPVSSARAATLRLPSDVPEAGELLLSAACPQKERRVSRGSAAERAGETTAASREFVADTGVTTRVHPAEDLADGARGA